MPITRKQTTIGLVAITLLTFLLLSLFLMTELRWTEGELGVPLDDAWIHYQFARNISQGQGFSFNPGEPTPGSTAPLWTLLLAGLATVTEQMVVGSIMLSALFLVLTVLLTFGLTSHLSDSRGFGLLAALGVALTGRLLWAGLAGMETTAFAAVSVTAVWLYAKRGLGPASALLFGLASQLRPEGHVLFLLALLDTGWVFLREARRSHKKRLDWLALARQFGFPLLIYLVVALPYTLFGLATTGKPFPNTFYAKAGTEHFFSFRTLQESIRLHWQDNYLAFLLLIPGIIPTWRRCRLIVAWLFMLLILTAFTVDFIWHHGRYTLPLAPFVVITAVLGGQWILQHLPARSRPWVGAIIVILFVIMAAVRLPLWATYLGQNSREILLMDVAMGNWLAQNTPPDALIAVDDIGAIGYLSGREIFDLNGLISPEMWPVIRDEPQGYLKNEAATRILSSVQADYLAIFPLWHWELANNSQVAKPITRFQVDSRTIIGDQEAVVYKTQWPYIEAAAVLSPPLAVLGEDISLFDYQFTAPTHKEDLLELTLFWQNQRPVTNRYDVFVHILNPDGEIVAQSDHEPVQGLAPTNRWQPGDIIRDDHSINWSQDLAGGTYSVRVGMYLRDTGERLPAKAAVVIDNAVELTTFEWPAVAGSTDPKQGS